jgi:acid phosphatase
MSTLGMVPRLDHIVLAVLENHSFDEVVGRKKAPFLNSLANTGAVMTQSFAVSRPSEPNYLALFSGSTQGLTSDSCPLSYGGPNLASTLQASGHTFVGYSEDLPAAGFTGCTSGGYVRKHNPWVDFPELPSDVNQPMTAFPDHFDQLPTVCFVVPNLDHDLHDGTLAQADEWLHRHLGDYAEWARTHNSLLIVTTDEGNKGSNNHIPTILSGAHIRPGRYSERTDHYGLLRTILDSYGLTPIGAASTATAITGIWRG